ncbi:putative membrane protein [Sphingomonas naasensis]|uniref:DUF2339 domain-containing protein n=1 Tax=Sphingomonas naasensis TaxID=1344951 RepID=A0A4S1WMD5_9SPHN|nr:DUF2339 domain-containing protein [Sphingomonas naasensis]NIJ20327.1 putative membrane protein [Sphingomonas naasensis]TGX44448.1 DUF2339 domain-containing protein [Sphingomonas naasensis]
MLVAITLIGLIIVCAKLWHRAEALDARLSAIELQAVTFPEMRPEAETRQVARTVLRPVPERVWAPEPLPEPEPEPEPEPVPEPEPEPEFAPVPEAAERVPAVPVEAFAQAAWPEAELAPDDPFWTVGQAPRSRNFTFEDVFGRHLPIWAGGVTLAVAGFLIVKYSIDAGLLSPLVRVICGLLFGAGLVAGAEAALRGERVVRDVRIPQALAGAGIATLYAAILVAANLYHLVAPMTAFAGLAAVTALAAILSIRFGAPSAVLGLIGGLAAPALVGTGSPNMPLLATYLALTVGGLCVLGRAQRWWWLGALAVTGGFGWGMLLIAGGLHDVAATLSVGTLTLILAIGFPLLFTGTQARGLQLAGALAGCAQIAAIVATGGFAGLDWGLFALISIAIIWLSRRDALFAEVPLAGLATGLLLALGWPNPVETMLALVLAGGAMIYGVPALWRLWRRAGALGDAVQIAAIALGVALLPIAHYWDQTGRATFAPLALLGAAIAGVAAAVGWRNAARTTDARFATLAVTALGLALLAAGLALPVWALAPATAVTALAAVLLARAASDKRIEYGSYAFGFAALAFLPGANGVEELQRALALLDAAGTAQGCLRWAIPALVALGFARWSSDVGARQLGQGAAVLLGYVAAAQLVPQTWLALVPAATIAALALAGARAQLAALGTAALLSAGWALQPIGTWLAGAGGALLGEPFFVTTLPSPIDVAVRIVAPMAALVVLLWRGGLPAREREIGAIVATLLGTITLHVAWKHGFAIDSDARFVSYGLAERTLWEMLLAAAAWLTWCAGMRRVATGLGGAALLHFGWFTVLLHNPLWAAQLAGLWLVPAYATALLLLGWSTRAVPGAALDRARDWARMVLIVLLAGSLLRQAFHGSLLVAGPTIQIEDICRSLLAILLAIGFLQWGIRRGLRDWRIASLLLMLGAVGKVFLFDAAGLDGLLRIASFAALGFSLIGMGWLYSRYLPDAAPETPLTDESHSADTVAADIRG